MYSFFSSAKRRNQKPKRFLPFSYSFSTLFKINFLSFTFLNPNSNFEYWYLKSWRVNVGIIFDSLLARGCSLQATATDASSLRCARILVVCSCFWVRSSNFTLKCDLTIYSIADAGYGSWAIVSNWIGDSNYSFRRATRLFPLHFLPYIASFLSVLVLPFIGFVGAMRRFPAFAISNASLAYAIAISSNTISISFFISVSPSRFFYIGLPP